MPDSNNYSAPSLKRQAMRPTAKTWLKHLLFLFITFCTVTISGTLPPFGLLSPEILSGSDSSSWSDISAFLIAPAYLYFQLIVQTVLLIFTYPESLIYGIKFSVSLLFILTCHEAGHYVACRIYGVDATLPYFIPTPPLIGPAGTLGAFIKMMSPLPSRRATFDIGVAGPIAGFVALIPIAIIGFLTMESFPVPEGTQLSYGLVFSDSLFTKLLAYLFGRDLSLPIYPNPFYFAVWVGLLVTSLNLIPSGQLDGGHAVYAVFGEKIHEWTGKIAFGVMVITSLLGWFLYNSPSGLLFTILLGVMLRISHPEPLDDSPLDFKRKVIAVITLIIFILCFTPFPIQVL